MIKIAKGRTSLFNPKLNLFVHFRIVGYNGDNMSGKRNNFQGFSLNINSGISSWGMVTERMVDQFCFMLIFRPKAIDAGEKLLTIH